MSQVTDAQQRMETLGTLAVLCTILGVIIAIVVLLRRSVAEGPHLSPLAIGLLIGIVATGFGVAQSADSIARWIETTKINPGDGLGLLPQLYAIVGSAVGVVAMVLGLLAVIASTPPRHKRAILPSR
jgi:hypothetical protein